MEEVKKEYYKSGALRSVATYRDGVLDGPYKSYYENGALHDKLLALPKPLGHPSKISCIPF